MAKIHLETFIGAPPEVCFDLCLDVNFHERAGHGRAVAGKTAGALRLGDTVTWEATHFMVRQQLTSKIVIYERPRLFVDEMQRGAFARWRHEHRFVPQAGGGTLATDDVYFASPLGPLGRLADHLVLESYMTRFLFRQNAHLKREAEQRAGRPGG
ncbi:MAG TPA: SRPBCC family protein [Pyrinomonadaceae bacterium]|nr:SRPBCC family protein [Pyrinomonadaceae bacterium]